MNVKAIREPVDGCGCLVRECQENRDNTFWAPYIGHTGAIARVNPDGKLEGIMADRPPFDQACPQPFEGADPQRFIFFISEDG